MKEVGFSGLRDLMNIKVTEKPTSKGSVSIHQPKGRSAITYINSDSGKGYKVIGYDGRLINGDIVEFSVSDSGYHANPIRIIKTNLSFVSIITKDMKVLSPIGPVSLCQKNTISKPGSFGKFSLSSHPLSSGKKPYAQQLLDIGVPNDADFDRKYIIAKHNIFQSNIMDSEANKVATRNFHGPLDLTHLDFITIDDSCTQDLDDAIHATGDAKDGWVVTTAIANPTHYVDFGSTLFTEAASSGVTTYLSGGAIPMLPELLSSKICSLKSNTPKTALCCEMKISPTGKISDFRFFEAIINITSNLSYCEAIKFTALSEATSAMKSHRMATQAYFHRDDLDYKIDLSNWQVVSKARTPAHTIVEEAMIATNVCCAKLLVANNTQGVFSCNKGIRKNSVQPLSGLLPKYHSAVDLNKITGFDGIKHLASCAHSIDDNVTASRFTQQIFNNMSRTLYKDRSEPHCGLGVSEYAPFTSPLRRLPDLINHYQVKAIINNTKPIAITEELLDQCNIARKNSATAERELFNRFAKRIVGVNLNEPFNVRLTRVNRDIGTVLLLDYGLSIEVPRVGEGLSPQEMLIEGAVRHPGDVFLMNISTDYPSEPSVSDYL